MMPKKEKVLLNLVWFHTALLRADQMFHASYAITTVGHLGTLLPETNTSKKQKHQDDLVNGKLIIEGKVHQCYLISVVPLLSWELVKKLKLTV